MDRDFRIGSEIGRIESLLDQIISVITNDGRNILVVLKGFDQATNIILDESHERAFSTKVTRVFHKGSLFSECRSTAFSMLQERKEKCTYKHCSTGSTFTLIFKEVFWLQRISSTPPSSSKWEKRTGYLK